jgi:hypothetical protein
MADATIQMTQGAVVGGSGESVLGFDSTTTITLTDDGGPAAISHQWEILSWPGPDAAAPTITNPTSQIATIVPSPSLTDGLYVVKLTRTEAGPTVTTDVRFFGVEDADGLSLPVAGVNRNMANVGGSVAAQNAGWFGNEGAGTNVLLDAFLRLRRAREGGFIGKTDTVSHSVGTPASESVVVGTNNNLRLLGLTGAGTFTSEISVTGAEAGRVFRYLVSLTTGAGDFILKSGIGGSTILTLSAPPSGTVVYAVNASYDGSSWVIQGVSLAEGSAVYRRDAFDLVAGLQENELDTFKRIGSLTIDPSRYPANTVITFQAVIETTVNSVECRLYNITDGGVVAGSTLTSTSTSSDLKEAAVTLPSAGKLYEVQLRITPVGGVGDRSACSSARLLFTWA